MFEHLDYVSSLPASRNGVQLIPCHLLKSDIRASRFRTWNSMADTETVPEFLSLPFDWFILVHTPSKSSQPLNTDATFPGELAQD